MAHILVIDDDACMRQVLATCLVGFGHSVEMAMDGEAGLKLADANVTDLILSDVEMPLMNGISLCEHLQGDPVRRHLPVLLMSGRMNREVQLHAERAGARAVLSKPFTWDQLQAHLDRFLPAGV
ncbi:MAG: two-component system response regulator [Verrucomicrobia bacterium]|nr:two-component system response regulator [Verrucomicrobiota bacterium]